MKPTKIEIETFEEYEYCVSRGYEPLLEFHKGAHFVLSNVLRREIQTTRFKTIESFYRYCYEHSSKRCEETGVSIPFYSAVNISHILTRGAHPAIAKDPRNFNLLTFLAHQKWEVGNRKSMRIYNKNQIKIEKLKLEYYARF